MAGRRLTITSLVASCLAPTAIVTESTVGRPMGIAAIMRMTTCLRASRAGRWLTPMRTPRMMTVKVDRRMKWKVKAVSYCDSICSENSSPTHRQKRRK